MDSGVHHPGLNPLTDNFGIYPAADGFALILPNHSFHSCIISPFSLFLPAGFRLIMK
jgi:hypothetical protein